MANTSTSIGRGPARGGNETHTNDPTHKTLGEDVQQEPPAGNDLLDEATPDVPAGAQGTRPKPGISKGPPSHPEGLNVEASPRELGGSRGKLPTDKG